MTIILYTSKCRKLYAHLAITPDVLILATHVFSGVEKSLGGLTAATDNVFAWSGSKIDKTLLLYSPLYMAGCSSSSLPNEDL